MTHPFKVNSPITATCATGDSLASKPPVAAASGQNALATAGSVLKGTGTCWLVVAVLGQLMFVAYLFGFYGRTAAQNQFEKWNEIFPHAHTAGDTVHNAGVCMHLAFAALIIVGGVLQLITGLRRLFPRFHRWNGRIYLLSACVMSLSGLIMVWTDSGVGDLSQNIAISINAVLILVCASMVLRHALARRFALHRRWALRLFLVVSGVWFFRIGLTFWILVNRGPAGFDPDTFRGPALTIIAFAQYLLPLAVLELYFRAQDSASARSRLAMAACLVASTLVTAVGIVAASMILWLPHL